MFLQVGTVKENREGKDKARVSTSILLLVGIQLCATDHTVKTTNQTNDNQLTLDFPLVRLEEPD